MENVIPKKYIAKKHNSDEYVIGYYVYLEQGNCHHWIISSGIGNGGYFIIKGRYYIDINTIKEYEDKKEEEK